MNESTERAVRRAIITMRNNLGEQITVEDLAQAAGFSKFHFSRVFLQVTGVSPGRFLSALRLQRAKTLLVSTALSVSDISLCVGYHSVGTFSSRFSRSVGMSPTLFRQRAGFALAITTDTRFPRGLASGARIYGTISRNHPGSGLIFLGLFADRIPEGRPVRCAVLDEPGEFQFDTMPRGSWYLLAQTVTGDPHAATVRGGGTGQVLVATYGPITVRVDTRLTVDLRLEPARELDPPVLLALPDARKLALAGSGREPHRLGA
ncbi:AraC family transcriptional regulator [Micromonospora sp. NPDC048999]|uniref:AraC family transcriptional regulator n=1 Tax=Micromonospora sp. NPDC048999 TaxID=3155391 RepID=UPI0033F42A7F